MTQYITLRVDIGTDMKSTALAKCEELLTEQLIANGFVDSVVILRNDGFANMRPDEATLRSK